MTSVTRRLERRIDATPASPVDPGASAPARRLLAVAVVLSAAALGLAVVGLVVDPRTIGGEPGWIKPAKFGVSITLYLVALRWILGSLHGHRRLTTAIAIVVTTALAAETVWIDLQVLRGTTSHFNTATTFDAVTFDAAGGAVSLIFLSTVAVAVLALRTRGLDLGTAAGIRWGLVVSALGMLEAVSMIVNGSTDLTRGAHTVGAPDGGPGLALTGWSLEHGDLRIAHFVGLHALQVLPLLAWLLLTRTSLGPSTRRALIRVAGIGFVALIALLWWQAERGQALLRPDALTLSAAGVLVVGVAAAAATVLRHDRARP